MFKFEFSGNLVLPPMETSKYVLVDPIQFEGRTLYRVKALKSFSDVKAGDVGGFVESDYNLSHKGDCWVYDDSIAADNTRIFDDSCIRNNSFVTESILNDSVIVNNSTIKDTRFYGNVIVEDITADEVTLDGNITIKNSQLNKTYIRSYNGAKAFIDNSNVNGSRLIIRGELTMLVLNGIRASWIEIRERFSTCTIKSCKLIRSRLDLTSNKTWIEASTINGSTIINIDASINIRNHAYIINSDIIPGENHDIDIVDKVIRRVM